MKAAGWPVDILTGSTPFKVGNNERHAASSEGDMNHNGEGNFSNRWSL